MSSDHWWGIDLAPLRTSTAYRRLYIYRGVGMLAAQTTYVTLMYQLKTLTHSALAVGALGLVELVPIVVCGLYGGVIADHFNRRRIIIVTEVGLLATSVALLINARLAHPASWVIYVVAALVAAVSGLQSPSLGALTQQLVPHHLQREAATLQMIEGTGASIVGPAIGGLVAVSVGPWAIYAADSISFAVTLFLLFGLQVVHRSSGADRPDFAALWSGARYAASRADVLGTYVVDLLAMTFAFPVALLPFVADRFHASYALAVLYCGLPVGALLATLTSRWSSHVHRYGRAVVAAAVVWGLGVALFGEAGSLTLAFVALAIAGGADAVSGIFRLTLWNESIPLGVRGRMAGIEMLSYSIGPTVGQFRAGVMAAALGLRSSLVIGGVACAGSCAVVPLGLRSMWAFDERNDPHVAALALERADEHFD